MTKQEIINDIVHKLHFRPPSDIKKINYGSSVQDLFEAVINITDSLQNNYYKSYELVDNVLTILEEHHKLTFKDKIEKIINE